MALGGPKPRLLLAALLCEPGRVVAVDELIDTLWGDSPPSSCRALVQTYVHGLRKVLGRLGAGESILTSASGYRVQVGPDDLDSVVFESLVQLGRTATDAGDHEEAIRALRAAEALWRGDAFQGVEASSVTIAAARLTELRLFATEQRIAAELALGHEQDVLLELTRLVAAHPTRERLRAHLMVTLYRLGRQADALQTYDEARALLASELGIDPGPELQRTHQAILRAEPGLLSAPATVPSSSRTPDLAGTAGTAIPPAQLPAVPADFTGRDAEIAQLLSSVEPGAVRVAGASATCVVTGPSGAGKSALALRVAHELAPHFPDGQLYADLRGSAETPALPADVLGRFLLALDADGALPESLDERADRFRTILAGRRVLIVLDDGLDERQVRPLLPSGPGNSVVITARRRLSGLAGVGHLELGMLSELEAVELLGRVAGKKRVIEEPADASEIVAMCGHLPLAVRIVGARLASRPHWTLATMVTRLTDESRRLDEIAIGDQHVVAGIDLTFRDLHVHARAALCSLGSMGLPDFPAWIVAPLLGVSLNEAENAVEQLIDAKAVDFTRIDALGRPRYRIHELVRVYAKRRALQHQDRPSLTASVRRLLLVWVRLIRELNDLAGAGTISTRPELPEPLGPHDEFSHVIKADPAAWLESEQGVLIAAIVSAAELDLPDVCAALATALYESSPAIGVTFESFYHSHASAVASARRTGDRAAEAALLTQLGQLCSDRDRYAESRAHLLEAVAIFRQLNDRHGEAVAGAAIGTAWWASGDTRMALPYLELAHEYFSSTTAPDPAAGFTARLIGLCHLEQGDFSAADTWLTQAVTLNRRLGSASGEALSIRALSMLHDATGDLGRALDLGTTALDNLRSLGLDLHTAYAAETVAAILIRLGRDDDALPMLDDALATCERLGDRWGQAASLHTRGKLHLAAGQLSHAGADLTRALEMFTAIDASVMRARTQLGLAALREAQGAPLAAASLRQAALDTFATYGSRDAASPDHL